jgi:hypothetical protein
VTIGVVITAAYVLTRPNSIQCGDRDGDRFVHTSHGLVDRCPVGMFRP